MPHYEVRMYDRGSNTLVNSVIETGSSPQHMRSVIRKSGMELVELRVLEPSEIPIYERLRQLNLKRNRLGMLISEGEVLHEERTPSQPPISWVRVTLLLLAVGALVATLLMFL